MAPAMSRQKGHPSALERPRDVGVGRPTKRGLDPSLLDRFEPLHLVEPAPADDPDQPVGHFPSKGCVRPPRASPHPDPLPTWGEGRMRRPSLFSRMRPSVCRSLTSSMVRSTTRPTDLSSASKATVT